MRKILIRWKLKEVMARYDIKGVDLAKVLDVSTNTITNLRKAKTMPRLDGEQLNMLLEALNQLAKDIDEVITHVTLIEYVRETLPPSTKNSKPFAHNKLKHRPLKRTEVNNIAKAGTSFSERSAVRAKHELELMTVELSPIKTAHHSLLTAVPELSESA